MVFSNSWITLRHTVCGRQVQLNHLGRSPQNNSFGYQIVEDFRQLLTQEILQIRQESLHGVKKA